MAKMGSQSIPHSNISRVSNTNTFHTHFWVPALYSGLQELEADELVRLFAEKRHYE